jgi:NAD(P)-dependent dehydrogenase (short-subunit alcohol dehydrogenase family)
VSRRMALLRDDLLAERAIALAGGVRSVIRDELSRLGAGLVVADGGALAGSDERSSEPAADRDGDPDGERAQEWARAHAPLHALVYDAQAAFGDGGPAGLQAALEAGWVATRAVATGALIPGGSGGTIVLLAPAPDAGPHAAAAQAALENLARTLSVEWARLAITTTMIAPGAGTTDDELATVLAFLVSPAGGYFSGCRFDLGVIGEPVGSGAEQG